MSKLFHSKIYLFTTVLAFSTALLPQGTYGLKGNPFPNEDVLAIANQQAGTILLEQARNLFEGTYGPQNRDDALTLGRQAVALVPDFQEELANMIEQRSFDFFRGENQAIRDIDHAFELGLEAAILGRQESTPLGQYTSVLPQGNEYFQSDHPKAFGFYRSLVGR